MSDKTPASRKLINITKALLDDANAENEEIRDKTIEECARVADSFTRGPDVTDADRIAAAIRALRNR